MSTPRENMFCKQSDLTNEASVETWFINPLLTHLGYQPKDIRLKTSLKEYKVGQGSKSSLYKPDYVILINKFPTLVIDAKPPDEELVNWTSQCSSYSLELNKDFPSKPVEYYLLSSGLKTSLYKWDEAKPAVDLDLSDFVKGNPRFDKLIGYISKANLQKSTDEKRSTIMESEFELKSVSTDEISSIFTKLHNFIWRTDKKVAKPAFEELMKIVFVKLKKDRELHQKLGSGSIKPKVKDVVFSVDWIENQTEQSNPINDPLFRNLVGDLEKEISAKNKKRIFEENEEITLNPATIEKIVGDLEHIDFLTIDGGEIDVHGRMFERFLSATIRGKDLGQYFTPRDIVGLMVKLADIQVVKEKHQYKIEKILDACCGSGGFLITAMKEMMEKTEHFAGVSDEELKTIRKQIVDESIVGIDAGSDPPIYRIARMNMYLHGDGGSKIFFADSLDKNIGQVGKSSLEVDEQLHELRNMLLRQKTRFDVILSNPPFSMTYSRKQKEQKEIMDQYDILAYSGANRPLLSSLMFLERYRDLVSENGRILAIIDESVLSGENYRSIRDYIRKTFIIKAIISLPGDAFRRQGSRVKTSILILRLKRNSETQPSVFMETSLYLGLTDKIAGRIGIGRDELRQGKEEETRRILEGYRQFENGIRTSTVVDASKLSDRLDVKYCLNDKAIESRKRLWASKGFKINSVRSLLNPAKGRSVNVNDDEAYTMLKITYDGDVLEAETKEGEEISYAHLYRVHEWDLLFSTISMGRGSIGIVPKYHDGKYVSSEYTILTAHSKEEALFYANIIHTKDILGDLLSSATGMNRGRIRWKTLSAVEIPVYDKTHLNLSAAVRALTEFWEHYSKYQARKGKAIDTVVTDLKLEGEKARKRWLAYKPPE